MTTTVHRHPTIPMTKRDSMVSNGSRVSLTTNGTGHSATEQSVHNDFINTHPEMVSGKKRTPKKMKRTDSYKLALNRESVHDTLNELNSASSELDRVSNRTSETKDSNNEGRQKYNTLPRTQPNFIVQKVDRRKKAEYSGSLERHASQKSGTYYPSPDTDDDQPVVQPERKKKSAFTRVKERLALTFKKDRDREKDKGKKKGDKYKSPGRVKPHHHSTRDAFRTPDNNGVGNGIEITPQPQSQNGSFVSGSASTRGATGQNYTTEPVSRSNSSKKSDDVSSGSNKSPGFLRSIRNSFRSKSSTRKSKKDTSSKVTTPESNNNTSSSQSPVSYDIKPTNQNEGVSVSQPIDIPHSLQRLEEEFIDADDTITGFFGTLIDPEGTSRYSEEPIPNYHPASLTSRPDRSKLKLEGLKKFKPRSIDRESPKQVSRVPKLSGVWRSKVQDDDIEIDGVDSTDGPTHSHTAQDESDVDYADASTHEQQRRVDHVARRLQAIGDSIVSRRESDSAGSSSDVDGPTHSRRLSQFEAELLRDLRQFGDEIDGNMCRRVLSSISLSQTVLPAVLGFIRAQDYSSFTSVVQREIENTVGWEQVAWYIYLMKATMSVAGVGQQVGRKVKNYATKYFTTSLRPWIQARPKGWESIHEETDIDSEVD